MTNIYRRRRFTVIALLALVLIIIGFTGQINENQSVARHNKNSQSAPTSSQLATQALDTLDIKGRAPKTGYTRAMFGNGWRKSGDCNTRDDILTRDLKDTDIRSCKVYSGTLDDPYTGKKIAFVRGANTSGSVQIDHVVALSDAWQKGAQALDFATRENLANDPLELLAVEGKANQDKSDGDAATWSPPNKAYRCRYVARQVAVKQKYFLWVTAAEQDAMQRVLSNCPGQLLPIIK